MDLHLFSHLPYPKFEVPTSTKDWEKMIGWDTTQGGFKWWIGRPHPYWNVGLWETFGSFHGFQHLLQCQNSNRCHNNTCHRSLLSSRSLSWLVVTMVMVPMMVMFLAGLWIHSVLNKHEMKQDTYLSQRVQQLLTGSGRLWLVGFIQIKASQLHRDFRSILGADRKLSLQHVTLRKIHNPNVWWFVD